MYYVSDTRYWIGALQNNGDNTDWSWVDGSPLSNTHHIWNTGEPYYDSEPCAEVRFYEGVLAAADVNCDRQYKYVCSMSAAAVRC